MAQSGFTPVQLYRSTTAAAVPLAADLAAGELAINIADMKLYAENSAGAVTLLASASGASGDVVGPASATGNNLAAFNGTTGKLIKEALTVTVAQGGTGVTTSTGTTNVVLSNSPTLVTPVLGVATATSLQGIIGNITPAAATVTTLTASADSAFTSTGSLTVSKGTTGQRPGSPVSGMFRFNTTTNEFEGFNGTVFASVGGAALSNDTATATSLFPLFANATTGTASSVFTSNAQYLFKPSIGELSVKAVRASNGIFTNSATVSADATIASGDNGGSFGPVTINSGITVTVSSGSVYTVI